MHVELRAGDERCRDDERSCGREVAGHVDLAEAKLLIADDVADTGRTLSLVRDFCAGKVAEVRTAVLYEKPTSVVACDYVWRRTSAWITFPWSALPPVGEALAHSGRSVNG